jgi:hypothetical protein
MHAATALLQRLGQRTAYCILLRTCCVLLPCSGYRRCDLPCCCRQSYGIVAAGCMRICTACTHKHSQLGLGNGAAAGGGGTKPPAAAAAAAAASAAALTAAALTYSGTGRKSFAALICKKVSTSSTRRSSNCSWSSGTSAAESGGGGDTQTAAYAPTHQHASSYHVKAAQWQRIWQAHPCVAEAPEA